MDSLFSRELNILIIDDNNAPFILPLIRSFSGYKNIHLDVLVFSNEKPHLFSFSKYLRHVYYIEGDISENFEKGVRDTIVQSNAHLLIPTREWISQLVSKHHNWLDDLVIIHPVSDVETIDLTLDKWKLNQWLKSNRFPFSVSYRVTQNALHKLDTERLQFPVLCKPRVGAGGIGITLMKDSDELEEAFSLDTMHFNGYIIQEFIQGYDIDVSFFAIEGKILFHTIQRGIMGSSFEFPKGIQFIKNNELFDLVTAMIAKLKYTGIAHLDFRFDTAKREYILVDFNARYWSSLQGSRLMGVNFPVLVTAYTLGISVVYPEYTEGYFFYGTTALKRILKNLVSKTTIPVRLSHSQIPSIIRDPLPEFIYLVKRLFRSKSQ